MTPKELERAEKKLQQFETVEDAIEHARKHLDCSTPDKACFIMKTPDKKKLVVAPLDICSYLHNKGYKEVIGKFRLYNVLQGEEEFTDTIEEA